MTSAVAPSQVSLREGTGKGGGAGGFHHENKQDGASLKLGNELETRSASRVHRIKTIVSCKKYPTCFQVRRELGAGKVLDVLVFLVDDVSQFPSFHFLLEHPHLRHSNISMGVGREVDHRR